MSKPVALCAVLVLGAMFMFGSAEAAGGIITTVAGGGAGDGGAATSASLNDPMDVAVDGAGNLYIADTWNCRIREVSGGTIATVAGNGSCGYSGDGGAATSAILDQPSGVAVDGAGSLYVTDTNNCRIRKVSSGMITTVAGSGSCGYSGDGGAAMSAALDHPADIAVDGAGNLFFTDANNCRVRKVSVGTITTVAGNGSCGYYGDGGAATSAWLSYPEGLAVDGTGALYIADWGNCRVRKVSAGTITTVAGNGTCGYGGDGGAATSASVNQPSGVGLDGAGNLYIGDRLNCRVREVSTGTITTVAGNGTCGYGGDGGAATSSSLFQPIGVASSGGNLYIADMVSCRVREVNSGTITTVAGSGSCIYSGNIGDGGPALSAILGFPDGVATDDAGNVYIAGENYNGGIFDCRVRKVSSGTITTVAGGASCAYGGDGGSATSASLNGPKGVVVDSTGNLYVGDWGNCRVRKVSGGTITTVAGNGSCAYGGDGGPATSASLLLPAGVALDGAGNLYIGDFGNCRIRMVSGGIITTVAGNGTCAYSGDGGAATSASLNNPYGVAVDYAGNLYIADQGNCRVRKVNGGTITTVAGNGSCGYSGDGGAATSASLSHPPGVAVDGAGDLYIADNNPECRIRKVSGGTITTVAGNGFCMYGGDGGAAASASITDPRGIAVDVAGNLYIAATNEHRVRKVSLAARVASVGGIAEVPAIAAPRSHPGGWPPPVLLIVVGAAIVTTAVLAAGGCQVARRKRL